MRPAVKRLALITATLGTAAGIAAMTRGTSLGGDAAEHYRTQPIATGKLTQSVSANGTLNPVTLVSVGTQVSGTVKKLYVDFNSKVEKGQPLLELDDALYAAQARQSAAAHESAKVALERTLANEQRLEALFAKGFVSRQEFDEAIYARKAAAAQVALTKASMEKDAVSLGYTVIRSPVSGVVVDRVVDVGQTVAANFQTPTLIKIAQDLSKMQIDASFAEADIGLIKLGHAVRFNVDAFPSKGFQGQVTQIRLNPTTVQNVVTYDVVVAVDNPEQLLLPGMTAYVSIAVATKDDVLQVPNTALRFKPALGSDDKAKGGDGAKGGKTDGKAKMKSQGGASGTVFVLTGEALRPVSLTLGISDNRMTEVVGGELKAGDVVVVGERPSVEGAAAGSASPMRMRLF